MPISVAGNRLSPPAAPQRTAGFTIIELMIVVTLIALATAAVAFALPDPRGRLDDDATRFAARARAAHDMAIIEGRSVSVWVAGSGYGFDRHDAGGWQPIAEKPLRASTWQQGVRATVLSQDGRERVIFDSTGFANVPLDLELKRGEERARVRIGSDGSVRVNG